MKQDDHENCSEFQIRLETERNRIESMEKDSKIKSGGVNDTMLIRIFLNGLFPSKINNELRNHLEREVNAGVVRSFSEIRRTMEGWFTTTVVDLAPNKTANNYREHTVDDARYNMAEGRDHRSILGLTQRPNQEEQSATKQTISSQRTTRMWKKEEDAQVDQAANESVSDESSPEPTPRVKSKPRMPRKRAKKSRKVVKLSDEEDVDIDSEDAPLKPKSKNYNGREKGMYQAAKYAEGFKDGVQTLTKTGVQRVCFNCGDPNWTPEHRAVCKGRRPPFPNGQRQDRPAGGMANPMVCSECKHDAQGDVLAAIKHAEKCKLISCGRCSAQGRNGNHSYELCPERQCYLCKKFGHSRWMHGSPEADLYVKQLSRS